MEKQDVLDLKENAGFFPSTTNMKDLVGEDVATMMEQVGEDVPEGEVQDTGQEVVSEVTKTPEQVTEETPEEEIEIPKLEGDSPFLEEPEEFKVEKLEDAYKAFNDLGYEVKSEQDLAKVITDFKQLKETEQTLTGEVSKLKYYEEFLQNVPDDIFQLLDAYQKGEDYRATLKTIANTTLDFTKDFKDHDSFELFQFYFPGKFSSKEDYLESDTHDILEKAVQDKYAQDRKTVQVTNKSITEKIQQSVEAVNESARQSIQGLKFKEDHKVKIAEDMVNGPQAFFNKYFVDEKGLWKPEAAAIIAKLKFHDSTVSSYKGLVNQMQTMMKDMVKRGETKPSARGTAPANEQKEIEEWAKKMFPAGTSGLT